MNSKQTMIDNILDIVTEMLFAGYSRATTAMYLHREVKSIGNILNQAHMYRKLSKAYRKAEKIMWESVERISELMDKLDDVVPDMVRDFMLHEYMSMYGAHFDEEMAREEVGKMSHYAADGTKVVGEIITPEDA